MEKYISVKDFATRFGISERTVRNYCANGKIEGAFLTGKTWNIPETADLPEKRSRVHKDFPILKALQEQKAMKLKGGIYHRTQIDLTYNSNHIEGSRLTHDQTRYIYETNTIGLSNESINVDDIVETTNHFRCIDLIIDKANVNITENLIKQLHFILKNGTTDSRKNWFVVGNYKKLPNEVGGRVTTSPEKVKVEVKSLIEWYNNIKNKTLNDIIEFHYRFEYIHPFQEGNGRVGRLLMFKECLKYNIVPFIIDEKLKMCYYKGLKEWKQEKGYLIDTCLAAQDQFKGY